MSVALRVCDRYVSLFHLLTAEDLCLWCVVFVCCLVCFFFFVGFCLLCFLRMRSSSIDRSWVTATSCLPSRFVKVRPSQLSWRARQQINKKNFSSSESSGSEPPASEVSDQHSMLEHAYEATQNVFQVDREGKLKGGMATLNLMEIFPLQWLIHGSYPKFGS